MRGDHVAVVRRWFEAFERGDPAPEMCDPEIEIENWTDFPIRGPYSGHDGRYPSPREARRAAGLD